MTYFANWLALHRAPGLGSATLRTLLDHFGTPANILAAKRPELAVLGVLSKASLSYLASPDWRAVERDLLWLNQPNHHLVTWQDDAYPVLLQEITDSPPLLFVLGNPQVLRTPQLAMVGSRRPTAMGKDVAYEFARDFCQRGLTVTSGLALGIDAASHRGALAAEGITIAVTGSGPDCLYPAEHKGLAEAIAERGALVTEFPPGTPPLAAHFPRRNRIISGLSLGTLVIEAALKSGSLITARLAAEQGRDVFAIPGSIRNLAAQGCHSLIKQGAKLVENADDVIEEIVSLAQWADRPRPSPKKDATNVEMDGLYARVYEQVGYEPTSIDTLIERTELTAEEVSAILLVLELHGHLASTSLGCYIRRT